MPDNTTYFGFEAEPISREQWLANWTWRTTHSSSQMAELRGLEWHGHVLYGTCSRCRKFVNATRLNGLHICVADEPRPWRVAVDDIADAHISTIWIGVNIRPDNEPPAVYETTVFGGSFAGEQWTWSARDEALRGHERVVKAVRKDNEKYLPGHERRGGIRRRRSDA